MSIFLTDFAKQLLSIGDIPENISNILHKIQKDPDYITTSTIEFTRIETAFEKGYIFEVGKPL